MQLSSGSEFEATEPDSVGGLRSRFSGTQVRRFAVLVAVGTVLGFAVAGAWVRTEPPTPSATTLPAATVPPPPMDYQQGYILGRDTTPTTSAEHPPTTSTTTATTTTTTTVPPPPPGGYDPEDDPYSQVAALLPYNTGPYSITYSVATDGQIDVVIAVRPSVAKDTDPAGYVAAGEQARNAAYAYLASHGVRLNAIRVSVTPSDIPPLALPGNS